MAGAQAPRLYQRLQGKRASVLESQQQ